MLGYAVESQMQKAAGSRKSGHGVFLLLLVGAMLAAAAGALILRVSDTKPEVQKPSYSELSDQVLPR